MTVLLIWQAIPENLQVYLLNVSESDGQRILKLSGKYGNQADNSEEIENELHWLSSFLIATAQKPILDDSDPALLGPFELNEKVKVAVSGVIL